MNSENLPGIGDNIQAVDYFKDEVNRLKLDYTYFETLVDDLIEESKPIQIVDSPETKETVKELIGKMRDTLKRLGGTHEAEKAPNLERGRADDSFFFALMDKLGRRYKKDKEGESDRLNRLLTEYDLRLLAEEQERRRKAAEEAAEIARKKEQERRKAEQEAEEKRLAAERARKPENIVAKTGLAELASDAASQRRIEEQLAAAKAEEAYIATLAKPADIMRERTDAGLSSMGTENFHEVIDRKILDLEALRPYFSADALDKALGAYARANSYSSDASVQIAGARFGKRAKSKVYR